MESYILLKQLRFYNPDFKNKYRDEILEIIQRAQTDKNWLNKTLSYMKNTIISIEILDNDGQLHKVYFQRPAVSQYLSTASQYLFIEKVNRDSATQKITALLENID